MADATKDKVPDGIDPKLDNKDQQQNNDKPKLYEESVVKEIIAERDKAKERLRKIESDQTANSKKSEEDQLKAKGDYEKLVELKNVETLKAIKAAQGHVAKAHMISLAVKNGMIDPDAVSMFTAELKFNEQFEIENITEIEKQFEDFKTKKPYLFKTEKKPVLPTDNKPFKKPDTNQFEGLTRNQMLEAAGQKMSEDYFGKSK